MRCDCMTYVYDNGIDPPVVDVAAYNPDCDIHGYRREPTKEMFRWSLWDFEAEDLRRMSLPINLCTPDCCPSGGCLDGNDG